MRAVILSVAVLSLAISVGADAQGSPTSGTPRIPEMRDLPAPAVLAPPTAAVPTQQRQPSPAATPLAAPLPGAQQPTISPPAPSSHAPRAVIATEAGTAASIAAAGASSVVRRIINGFQIPLPPDDPNLSVDVRAALTAFLRAIPTDNTQHITIHAYAAGTPDDTSTPRRLSLQRARAALDILVQAGADPRRIDLRPMGITATDTNMPDRLEITLGTAPR